MLKNRILSNKCKSYILGLLFCLPALTTAQVHNFIGIPLMASETVPLVASDAQGVLNAFYDDESNTLTYSYSWKLSKGSEAMMAHFHGPAKRGEIANPRTPSLADFFLQVLGLGNGEGGEGEGLEGDLENPVHNDTPPDEQLCELLKLFGIDNCAEHQAQKENASSLNSGFVSGKLVISQNDEDELLNGLWYLNFHTTAFPTGELRAQLIRNTPENSISSFNAETLELKLPVLLLGEQAYDITLGVDEKEGEPVFNIKDLFFYGARKSSGYSDSSDTSTESTTQTETETATHTHTETETKTETATHTHTETETETKTNTSTSTQTYNPYYPYN